MKNRKAALIIIDGYGESSLTAEKGNAVKAAIKPNIDALYKKYPHTLISASGLDVGLPEGQMGNSEVGHLNIGGGRVVYQDLTMINKAIEDRADVFYKNSAFLDAIDSAVKKDRPLHLMGLLSDGGVHSHKDHLIALIDLACSRNAKKIYIHAFMDGRDTGPQTGIGFIKELSDICAEKSEEGRDIKVASISGRYYAMDRDKRWERTEGAYRALTTSGKTQISAVEAMQSSYDCGVTDEFVKPIIIDSPGVQKGDSLIFFNFRPDRARQISHAFLDLDFPHFQTENLDLVYIGFTKYDDSLTGIKTAFDEKQIKNTLGEYISSKGLKQLRIAETEKYAHVTFFFNGGEEPPNSGEDRVLIPSPKVATYDLKPEMSAFELTSELSSRIKTGAYDLIICNFANSDMVGHTGNFDAAVAAVEAVDTCLGKLIPLMEEEGYSFIITADHGNSECMKNDDGSPMTAHTANLVPLILAKAGDQGYSLKSGGKLADLAPTLLELMGLDKPKEMTGVSLIK